MNHRCFPCTSCHRWGTSYIDGKGKDLICIRLALIRPDHRGWGHWLGIWLIPQNINSLCPITLVRDAPLQICCFKPWQRSAVSYYNWFCDRLSALIHSTIFLDEHRTFFALRVRARDHVSRTKTRLSLLIVFYNNRTFSHDLPIQIFPGHFTCKILHIHVTGISFYRM